MASNVTNFFVKLSIISLLVFSANAQLSANFYAGTCPNLLNCEKPNELGGPTWTVSLGRRDANSQIPSPFSDVKTLISMFSAKGLNAREMTTLSGGHSVGQAQCLTFRNRIHNETNIAPVFASNRRGTCPTTGGDSNLAPLDIQSLNRFGNEFYTNLVNRRGLLHSDQVLFNSVTFANDFEAAMVKMGNISPLTGTNGEIRKNCRVVN